MDKRHTSLRIPATERIWLENQAERTGLSISDIVRLSIRKSMESGALALEFRQPQPAGEASGDGQRRMGT